jgi:hypothetical protein
LDSKQIQAYFKLIENQRYDFYNTIAESGVDPQNRPLPDKWSVNETIYHLVLMVRLVRRFSSFYLPIMLPYGKLRKNRPYKIATYNIYEEFTQNKKKSMNAPFVLTPPKNIHQKKDLKELQQLLNFETDKLKNKLSKLDERVAGQIRYPDPIANYPNVVQSVHLLAIHEQHHFDLTLNYELQKNIE